MIEVRTYEETAEELFKFVLDSWLSTYAGKMMVPLWSPEYFKWQLLAGTESSRDYIVGAYKGSTLVGCLPAEPIQMQVCGHIG